MSNAEKAIEQIRWLVDRPISDLELILDVCEVVDDFRAGEPKHFCPECGAVKEPCIHMMRLLAAIEALDGSDD